jgi:hypothetical protein
MHTATAPAATLADLAAALPRSPIRRVLAGAMPDELTIRISAHWQARR